MQHDLNKLNHLTLYTLNTLNTKNNTRILFFIQNGQVEYLLGTGDELIPLQNETTLSQRLKPLANRIAPLLRFDNGLFVLYLEGFDGKPMGPELRASDMFFLPQDAFDKLMNSSFETIRTWQNQRKCLFFDNSRLIAHCLNFSLPYSC